MWGSFRQSSVSDGECHITTKKIAFLLLPHLSLLIDSILFFVQSFHPSLLIVTKEFNILMQHGGSKVKCLPLIRSLRMKSKAFLAEHSVIQQSTYYYLCCVRVSILSITHKLYLKSFSEYCSFLLQSTKDEVREERLHITLFIFILGLITSTQDYWRLPTSFFLPSGNLTKSIS